MFTIDQIKAVHSKVKSGADFPQYVQDIKALGVVSYNQYVADGRTVYNGQDHIAEAPAKYQPFTIASTGNKERLAHHLKIHQAGETDYLTFCRHAAEDGVEKWTVDTEKMTCTYYDLAGNVLIEEVIPTV
ncbi:DUF1398 domain-containing protein [Flavobacterium sp. Sd200]|nr:DUF1398 family protein [Flavobacterium sp. Sd200]MXN92025.1 DUF1398 domain-containing protein [Flavobacterium sp. Sd200]